MVITVIGTNDAAVIAGDMTGAVSEDLVTSASGTITVADPDHDQNHTRAQVNKNTLFGTFNVDTDGEWTYALDHNRINWLRDGDTRTDTIAVQSTDGTIRNVVVTITGTNDTATITGAVTGSSTENTLETAWGTLAVSDPDSGQNRVQASTQSGSYGTFTVNTNGNWGYALNSGVADPLQVGDTRTETFTVLSADGTDSQDIVVTIHGANDAALISGDVSGDATENGTTPGSDASGDLAASDVDNTADLWTAVAVPTLGDSGHGSYTIDASGVWSYVVDQADPAVDALNTGDTLTDTFTATTTDGTTQQVTVTIHGANDTPPSVTSLAISETTISFIATTPGAVPMWLTNPFAAAFGNPSITSGATTNLTPTEQATAVQGTLQVAYTGAQADVVGLYLGTSAADSFTAGGSTPTAIYGFGGDDTLAGGAGADWIFGGIGNDTISGAANDALLDGGANSDTLNIGADFTNTSDAQIANIENIVLTAAGTQLTLASQTEGFNITGSSGTDFITGGSGADTFDNGGGTDSITGAAGADIFNVTSGNVTIADLANEEVLAVSAGATAAATLASAWTATAATSNAGTASVNANGYAISLEFATGTNGWTLTNTSSDGITMIGSAQADSISGGSGNDIILGAQNDTLLNGGSGTGDALNIGANFSSSSDAQIVSIENINLLAAVTLDLSNQTEAFTIFGNLSGADTITGGSGADSISANGGNDTITGAQNDTLLDGGAGTGDTLRIGANFTSTGDGQIANIENILLTAAGTTLVLTNQTEAFTITGSSGNDTITGGGAADIIDGGGGTDSVTGGAGADRFNVTAGTVTITDLGGSKIVVVSSGATAAATLSAAWTATATTSNAGTASVNANGFNVSVALATGANGWTLTNSTSTGITMTGSANADSITGGSGDDTIVGAQADTLLDGSGGTDTLNIGANFTTTGDSQIANIENILLTAAATLVLTGQTEGFTITGSASADSITGGGGNDIIVAVDTDTKVDGGGTGDIVRYAAAVTAANLLDADLVNVENVGITNTGNASYNFSAQTEALVIVGNTGNDTITGGSAADTITGGAGTDTLTGGSGNDIFVALTGTIGIDSLTDFDFGTGSTSVDQFNLAGRALSFNSSYDLAFLESAGTAFSLDEDLVILNSSQRANLAAVDTYYETRSTAGNATNADIIVIWEDTSGLVHVSQGKGSAGTNGSDNGNEWAFTDLFTLNSSQHLIGGTGNITANINLGDFIVV